MILDELVTKFGIDVDIEKLKAFVGAIGNAAKTIADKANQANAALQRVNDNAIAGAQQVGEQAQAAEKPLNRLRLLALGVTTVISAAAAKVLGFVMGAIGGARDLAKEKGLLYQISERELEQADAYSAALKRNQLAVDSLRTKIALNLTPALTRMAEGFYQILLNNKDLITNGLTKLIKASGKVVQVLFNAGRAVDRVISSTIGWKNALLVLVAVLGIVKREAIKTFIANPVMLVIGAIAGLLLLLDDLMTYLDGGDAQFGEFWGACIKWIKQVKKWWADLSGELKSSLLLIGEMLAFRYGLMGFRSVTKNAGILSKSLRLLLSPLRILLKTIQFFMREIGALFHLLKVLANVLMWVGKAALFVGRAIFIGTLRTLVSLLNIAGKAALFFGRALFANPIGIIIGLIAGLAYVLYDLYQWLNGGESAFGEFWQGCVDMWEKVKTAFSDAWETIVGLFSGWLTDIGNFIDDIGNLFNTLIDKITAPFKSAFDEVKRYYDDTVGRISGAWDSVTGGASKAWNATLNAVGLSDSTTAPQPANYTSQNNSNSATINGGPVTITNNISTNEPQAVRPFIEKGVERGYSRALLATKGVLKQ